MTGVTDAFQAKARERTDWRVKRAEEERAFEKELSDLRGHIKLEAQEWTDGQVFADTLMEKAKAYAQVLEDKGVGSYQSGSDLWNDGGLRSALRVPVCSKTQVLVPRGTVGIGGLLVDITAGKFGFGLRFNVNSQGFDSLSDFKKLWANRERVSAKLEELRLKKTKKMFDELCAVAGDVEIWSDGEATVELPAPLPVELTEGSYVFKAIKFSDQGISLVPESNRHGLTLVSNWRYGSVESKISEPDVYIAFRALEPHFKAVLAGADEAIARASRYSKKEIIDKLQEATGRYLLLDSL